MAEFPPVCMVSWRRSLYHDIMPIMILQTFGSPDIINSGVGRSDAPNRYNQGWICRKFSV